MIGHVKIIQLAVCAEFGVPVDAMTSPRRTFDWVLPRMVAMYLSHTSLPNLSYVRIGRMFYRDHTTVLHAIDRITDMCGSSTVFAERVATLDRTIQAQIPSVNTFDTSLEAIAVELAHRIVAGLSTELVRQALTNPARFLNRCLPPANETRELLNSIATDLASSSKIEPQASAGGRVSLRVAPKAPSAPAAHQSAPQPDFTSYGDFSVTR